MSFDKLLTREEFRTTCLERDGHKCRLCGEEEGLSVHHILERKLWGNGGYYKTNGITVCPTCHIEVEAGFIRPNKLWAIIGAGRDYLYPDGLDTDDVYDKWGQKLIWWSDETLAFIIIPNEGNEKFEKAVRHAGGVIREINGRWLQDFMGIDEVEDDGQACYVVKGQNGEY